LNICSMLICNMAIQCIRGLITLNPAGCLLRCSLNSVRRNSARSSFVSNRSKVVTIRASEVAAILDRNKFVKRSEIFDTMWKRHAPATFSGQTKDEIALSALERCDPAEKSLLVATAQYRAKDAIDAKTQYVKAEKTIKSSITLSPIDKAVVLDQLKSQVFTAHGIRAESKTADLIQEKENVVLQVDEKFYNFPLCVIGGTRYQISGKIDRIEQVDDEIILVEIKNRMNKLFTTLPDYEFIQVQTYFQIIPLDIQRAKVIQQHQSETSTIMVERDDAVWNSEILPPILDFCSDLHSAMTSDIQK
jgi:hypothetical protein